MARVGEEFPFVCPGCGGDIRLIAFITEPGPIRKILTHLGEPLEPPAEGRQFLGRLRVYDRHMVEADLLVQRDVLDHAPPPE